MKLHEKVDRLTFARQYVLDIPNKETELINDWLDQEKGEYKTILEMVESCNDVTELADRLKCHATRCLGSPKWQSEHKNKLTLKNIRELINNAQWDKIAAWYL